MKKRQLGNQGPIVSAIGLGCMAMSEFYGPSDDAASRTVILSALEQGLTFLDTADTYGAGHNEELIGKVLKAWNGEVFVATKFGIVRKPGEYARTICGKPEYVRQACEASLRRLDRETIDLYYAHRIDETVPIEETVGAMAGLVKEGKVRYIGLSEPAAATLRRGPCCASHCRGPIGIFVMDPGCRRTNASYNAGVGCSPGAVQPLGARRSNRKIKQPKHHPKRGFSLNAATVFRERTFRLTWPVPASCWSWPSQKESARPRRLLPGCWPRGTTLSPFVLGLDLL